MQVATYAARHLYQGLQFDFEAGPVVFGRACSLQQVLKAHPPFQCSALHEDLQQPSHERSSNAMRLLGLLDRARRLHSLKGRIPARAVSFQCHVHGQ